jgi:hypothetical protein
MVRAATVASGTVLQEDDPKRKVCFKAGGIDLSPSGVFPFGIVHEGITLPSSAKETILSQTGKRMRAFLLSGLFSLAPESFGEALLA